MMSVTSFSEKSVTVKSGRRTMILYQMPFGKVTTETIVRITKVSDEYSTGRLHITAWNIQIHYVKFRQTPQLLG
jgi:sulfite reductase beta subunit-like hemoprotein